MQFVAGVKPSPQQRRKKGRSGRRHKRKSDLTAAEQLEPSTSESSPASSKDCTPEKPEQQQSRWRMPSGPPAVETVAKPAVTVKTAVAKRQREDSPSLPARKPSGGLLSDQFGDIYLDYKTTLERAEARVYELESDTRTSPGHPPNKSKYAGVATSSGNISHYALCKRRDADEDARKEYHNSCARRHCEYQLLNNPFHSACQCRGDAPGGDSGDLVAAAWPNTDAVGGPQVAGGVAEEAEELWKTLQELVSQEVTCLPVVEENG